MDHSNSILTKSVQEQLHKIKRADILIGIPSYGDSETINHVISTAGAGIARFYPGLKGVIVNSYGARPGDRTTHEAAQAAVVPFGIDKIVAHYTGISGKGSAFRMIFEIADRLGARIVMTLDADLKSIKPTWIKLLADPVYKLSYGFVTPYYLRHKHDGTITNSIVYPLTRALYGRRVRQPIGGEFCFSGALAKIYAHQQVWSTDIARFGIDVWMTTTAITEGFRLAQASMGVKLHDDKDPASDLAPMFKQVTGTCFKLMGENEVRWKAITGSNHIFTYGAKRRWREPPGRTERPRKLVEHFKAGFRTHQAFLKHYLSPANFQALTNIASAGEDVFHFPEELWARVVYDFAVAYNFSGEDPEMVVGLLTPVYYGRTASFILEVQGMSDIMVESLIEGQALLYEDNKSYLIKRWNEAKKLMEKGT
ncbi:MAG: glycosyl transferase family 2 [Actinomycetota bacterium]